MSAQVIAVQPFQLSLRKGHAVHLRCFVPEVVGLEEPAAFQGAGAKA